MRGKIPHSVDSTAGLVEIRLRDRRGERSEQELRLGYSMVITRTVNGLVDPAQQGYYADSVSTLAGRIGLPQWLVELRHDATHNQLPSLSLLRAAAAHLLSWLDNNYWTPQFTHLQQITELCMPSSSTTEETQRQVHEVLFGRHSTAGVQLFLPLFLKAVILLDAEDSSALQQACQQQESLWLPSIQSIAQHSASFVHAAVCHLLAETAAPRTNTQRSNALVCIEFWLKRLVDIHVPAVIAFAEREASRDQVRALLEALSTPARDSLRALLMHRYLGLDEETDEGARDGNGSRRKRRQRLCKWPIGCVPGTLSCAALQQIEYAAPN